MWLKLSLKQWIGWSMISAVVSLVLIIVSYDTNIPLIIILCYVLLLFGAVAFVLTAIVLVLGD